MRNGFISLLALAVVAGCAREQQKELKPGEKAIILTGKVVAFQQTEVNAPISAVVDKIMVQPGDKVKAGQTLIRLDENAAKAEVSRAEAAVITARGNVAEARGSSTDVQLAEAEAEVERLGQEVRLQKEFGTFPAITTEYEQSGIVLENAKAKLERMYALFARRLVTQPEVESAQNEYAEALRRYESTREVFERKVALKDSDAKVTEARYKAAKARMAALRSGSSGGRLQTAIAQLRQAEADLERARYNLGQTDLKAPFAGVVTEVTAQPGNKAYEGRPLVTVADIARVKIQADLSPGLLPFVHMGQKAQVTINTVPPTTVPSAIDRINTVADPKTQSLAVILILPNLESKFQPGYTARVEIPVDRSSPSKQQTKPEEKKT